MTFTQAQVKVWVARGGEGRNQLKETNVYMSATLSCRLMLQYSGLVLLSRSLFKGLALISDSEAFVFALVSVLDLTDLTDQDWSRLSQHDNDR